MMCRFTITHPERTVPMTRTAAWLACLLLTTAPALAAEVTVTGKVYQERDGKPGRGPTDPGMAGVQVSNGEVIVRTAADGSYSLPVRDGQTVFVIKPDEYRFPAASNGLPSYWRHYAPQGSPRLKYDGIRATGSNVRNWDFALEPAKGSDAARAGFEMLVFTDSQTASRQDIDYYQRAIVDPIIGKHPARLGTTLGDIVNDDLDLYPTINKATALLQVPWFHVPGNHDLDFDAGDDRHSLDSWRAVYGPDTYAVEEGGASFVFLDDVVYDPAAKPSYVGGLRPDQFTFLGNYLKGCRAIAWWCWACTFRCSMPRPAAKPSATPTARACSRCSRSFPTCWCSAATATPSSTTTMAPPRAGRAASRCMSTTWAPPVARSGRA